MYYIFQLRQIRFLKFMYVIIITFKVIQYYKYKDISNNNIFITINIIPRPLNLLSPDVTLGDTLH